MAEKIGGNLKTRIKSLLWSFYFSNNQFLVPSVFSHSSFHPQIYFYYFLVFDLKEKNEGKRKSFDSSVKEKKFLIDTVLDHKIIKEKKTS